MRSNSLNTFRLIAALEVIYSHTVNHLQIMAPPVIGDIIRYFAGVPIFFTLSGFLIWMSVGRSLNYLVYVTKRFCRIYPELWAAVAVEIGVLLLLFEGPILIPQFIAFIFGQATVFQFWTLEFLRTYGCGVPNGALWTISVLIQFYVVVWFFYKWLHRRSLTRWIFFIAVSICISIVSDWITLPTLIEKLYQNTFIPYLWMFLLASLCAEFKDKILPLLKRNYLIFFALSLIVYICIDRDFCTDIGYRYGILRTITLLTALLGIGYALPQINVRRDVSYGLYIYHMTIVNAMLVFGLTEHPYYLFVAIALSLLVAYISTITIGEWSKKLKAKYA